VTKTLKGIKFFCLLFAPTIFVMQVLATAQETSKAQTSEALKTKDFVSVYVFDRNGNLKNSVKTTHAERKKFKSLEEFVRSKDSPIDTCKNPVPTTPPPQCVICDDGQTVCTKAKFSEGLALRNKSD
jgi:hypothetical protein